MAGTWVIDQDIFCGDSPGTVLSHPGYEPGQCCPVNAQLINASGSTRPGKALPSLHISNAQ